VGETNAGAGASITVNDDGGVVVVELHGEHDIATAPELRAALERALEVGRGLVVDLTSARFVDSTILGVLISARDRARERSLGFAALQGPGSEPGVQRILDVTGLIPLLTVVDSLDAARDAATG
jgi:anti-sigma B factor antagonist